MTKYVTPVLVLVVAVLAVALFVRGGEVITALQVGTTNTSPVTVNVTNQPPNCSEMTCYDEDGTTDYIDLVAGGTRLVYCNATCNDPNGVYDMDTFVGQIQTGGAGPCTADTRNCYVNTSCSNTSTGNGTATIVECSYWFYYHADNTSKSGDWTGNITAVDTSGTQGHATDTIDVQELLAIGVDPVLAFGSKPPAVNDTTCTKDHTLFNYGNVQIDFQVNASDLTCDVAGSIPAGYLAVNLTSGDSYDIAYHLTSTLGGPDTGNKFDNFNLDESSATGAPTPTTKETYWGIGVPSGVSGNCQGTIWFAAVLS